jgi:hypothetical protein
VCRGVLIQSEGYDFASASPISRIKQPTGAYQTTRRPALRRVARAIIGSELLSR